MSALIFPSRWTLPPVQATVARGHPLANGLLGAYLFPGGQGGRVVRNLADNNGDADLQSGAVWSAHGIDTSAETGDLLTRQAYGFTTSGMSYFAVGIAAGTHGAFGGIIEGRDGANANGMLVNAAGTNLTGMWDGAGFDFDSGLSVAAANCLYRMSVSISLTRMNVCVNGAVAGLNVSYAAVTSNQRFRIGLDENNAARRWNGTLACAYIWRRALTVGEQQWLNVEPYAMFSTMRRYAASVAAGPVISMDAWAGLSATLADHHRLDVVPYH